MDDITGRVDKWQFVRAGRYLKAVQNMHSPAHGYSFAIETNLTTTSALIMKRDDSLSFYVEAQKLISANLLSTTILEGSWIRAQYENVYNPPMWTIAVEYRASLLLFLVQLAVCQFRPAARVMITITLTLWSIYADRFEMVLFLGGFLIVQLDPILTAYEMRLKSFQRSWKVYTGFMIALLMLGLYLVSSPLVHPDITPGYIWLTTHIPSTVSKEWVVWFWPGQGGLLVVLAVSRLRWIADLFTAPLIQYLGQVSFSIYLMHWFVELVFGTTFFYAFGTMTTNLDRHSTVLFWTGQILTITWIYVLVPWAGDVWCRLVDTPTVKFAKWLEQKLI